MRSMHCSNGLEICVMAAYIPLIIHFSPHMVHIDYSELGVVQAGKHVLQLAGMDPHAPPFFSAGLVAVPWISDMTRLEGSIARPDLH